MGFSKMGTAVACLLLFFLMAGCQSRDVSPEMPPTPPTLSAPSAISVSSEEKPSSPPVPAPSYSLANIVLGGVLQELNTFSYYGPALIIHDQDIGFTMPTPIFSVYGGDIAEQLAHTLSNYGLDKTSRRETEAAATRGDGDFVSFSLSTLTDGSTFDISLYRDGDVFISAPGNLFLRFQADHESRYPAMLNALSEAKKTLETLPYEASASTSSPVVQTDSPMVKVYLSNSSKTFPLTCQVVGLEQEASSGWEALPHEPYESLTLEPGDLEEFYLDLTSYENARSGKSYRIRVLFQRGEEQHEAFAEYQLAPDGEPCFPPPPEMTPENKAYSEKYLTGWGGVGDVMQWSFSRYNMATILEGNLYLIFTNLSSSNSSDHQNVTYDDQGNALISASVVEDLMCRRFPITAEQVRAMALNSSKGDRYDAEKELYIFHTGYGGGGSLPVVTASNKVGELLTLECSWYSAMGDNSPGGRNRLTIGVKDDGDFMYLSNEVLR